MEDMLAYLVREAREKSDLTQEGMAEKMGISRKTYLYLEKEPRKMTVQQAVDFCAVTGFSFNAFSFANEVRK